MSPEITEKTGDCKKSYEQFSKYKNIVHEDRTNRIKLKEILRSQTSKSGDESVSLKEYVGRMKNGRNDFYYITGENVSASPFPEKGLEVNVQLWVQEFFNGKEPKRIYQAWEL